MGWLYLAGNSLIVAGIRQQAGNTGNTAASGQQCSCSYAEFSRTGCPRITDMSSHSGRIMPRHKISTFVGSQRSKLVGFHVTRAHKGREQWDMKLLNLDACEHKVWEPQRSAEVQSSEQGCPWGEIQVILNLKPPDSCCHRAPQINFHSRL